MTVSLGPADLPRLRRVVLESQGLLRSGAFGSGSAGALKAIEHIAYVQIDSISVVERAHHHVLYSRVPRYVPTHLDHLLAKRQIFEYWTHAAAFISMQDYRFSLPYKRAIQNGRVHWFASPDKKLMAQLLERIRRDGPLRSRDLESSQARRAGWWDWKPAKKALEQLYMEGELMVSHRDGFQKTYDLSERVLPAGVDTRLPDTHELAQHLLEQQLRCQGCVSVASATYLRRDGALRQAVKALIEERVADRRLESVELENGEVYAVCAGALEGRLPRVGHDLRILSPFDNLVIQRPRLRAIFDFEYQLECYVPAAKREHGYFSLPLLYRDRFVGRMDCKAHRKIRQLEIKALHWEALPDDSDALMAAFVQAVRDFCRFQDCDSVSLTRVYPSAWMEPLEAALRELA